jgi:hypothetical protein
MITGQSSSAYTCDATPHNWCLYDTTNVADGKIEKDEKNEKKKPYPNIAPQDILSMQMAQSQFNEVMELARHMVFDSMPVNRTEADFRHIFADVFEEVSVSLRYGTLPASPCRITQLPDTLFELAISYQSPRDLRALRGVSHMFNQVSIGFEQASLLFYCKGRLAWFAVNDKWVLGVVICYVDIVDPNTYVISKGIHVYTSNGITVYFANSELAKYSNFRQQYNAPVCPAHITRTTNDCPDGNTPHNICQCGHWLSECALGNGTTAPSSCDVVTEDIYLNPQLVGCVIYMGSLTRHTHHQRVSLEREWIYGVAYNPVSVIQQRVEPNWYINDLIMITTDDYNHDVRAVPLDDDFNYDDMPELINVENDSDNQRPMEEVD